MKVSAPGRVFFSYYFMQYNKPALSIESQINLLEQRGLIISNKSTAENYLSHISFYRLRAYTFPYQNNTDTQHSMFQFSKNRTFLKNLKNNILIYNKISIFYFYKNYKKIIKF